MQTLICEIDNKQFRRTRGKMKRTLYKWSFLLLIILNLSACGTVLSLMENDYTPYAGVAKDLGYMHEQGVFSFIVIIDLPLSFAFDTLLLPITLTQ